MTLKSGPKKSLFFRKQHFLSGAIDLKQSVEVTLKLWETSLTTVLDDIYFIVHLYNFHL